MKGITSFAASAKVAGLLAAAIVMPVKADGVYCSGYMAGYKAGYCSKAVRLSRCNPDAVECSPLAGDGYSTGYMDGQRAGSEAGAAKQQEEADKSAKPGSH